MQPTLIQQLRQEQCKKEIPEFNVGDTVRVHVRVLERAQEINKGSKNAKGGAKATDKERVQAFTGTVIARKGHGVSETFSLHRVAYGEGMERVFCLHSPKLTQIELIKRGDVRRSKLYHLRGTSGKKAKVKELILRKEA